MRQRTSEPFLWLLFSSGGVMAALDGSGRVWESADNGLRWREVAPPDGVGRPTAIALLEPSATLWMAARPLALSRRRIGDPGWVPLGTPAGTATGAARFLASEAGAWFASVDGAGLWVDLEQPEELTRLITEFVG